jgi:hypothetical protein
MQPTPLNTRQEVIECLHMLPQVEADIEILKNKWDSFYFGSISPFKIFHVSKEDFLHLRPQGNELKVQLETGKMQLVFGEILNASIVLFTPIDAELLQLVIAEKYTSN